MHKAKYTDRVEIQQRGTDWVIVHVVTAHWKNESLDIYEEDENGICRCRNLYLSNYAGYFVAFPGYPYDNYYYGNEIATLEDWAIFKRHQFASPRYLTELEKDKLLALYPNFKYILQKWNNATIYNIMKVLPLWKKHNEIELLLAAGFEKVAFNQSFYKLKNENKKKIIRWIIQNPEFKQFSLMQIQIVINNQLDALSYQSYINFCKSTHFYCKYKTYQYLTKHNLTTSNSIMLYRDYIQLLKQTNHNQTESYWLYPSDLDKAHQKLIAEINNIKKMQREKEREKFANSLAYITSKASKYNTEIDGYKIFVTNNIDIWNQQAKKLHQCIVSMDYMSHMAKGNSIIVFIQKNGIPIATAEVYKTLKLGQFYADEENHTTDGCIPKEEVRNAFNQYLATLKTTIFQKNKAVENVR